MGADDPQLTRIYDELESIRAQLRSMTESISNNNNAGTGSRVTALEAWREGHEKYIATLVQQRTERDAQVIAELKKIPELEKLVATARGVSIAISVGFGLLLSLVEAFHALGVFH